MAAIPSVDESEIRNRVGEQSFERGQGYFRHDAVFNTRREGSTLRARCQGTVDEPYRVEVTLDSRGVVSAMCSCPVGHGGYCKHVAALLLAWRERPEDFVEVEGLDQALERRTKHELILLVKQSLRRFPELEVLLELPLPTGETRDAPVKSAIYRRQAAAVFRRADPDEWGVEATIADELMLIADIGDSFARLGDLPSAAVVYVAVAAEVIENYPNFLYDDGTLAKVVDTCLRSLGDCLDRETAGAADRQAILRALFETYRLNAEAAGELDLGYGAREIILGKANEAERQLVASWLRAAIAPGSPDEAAEQPGTDVDAQDRAGERDFLFDLLAGTVDDETYLRLSRAAGRTAELVDRLLLLGRVDEAIAELARAPDHTVVAVANRFVERGLGDAAECVLAPRATTTSATSLLTWLIHRAVSRGDHAAALELSERVFRLTPSLTAYHNVRELAHQLGTWESIRPRLRNVLEQAQLRDLLVEVYLADGEIDRALDAVRAGTTGGRASHAGYGYGYGYDLTLEVAAAAEATRPHAALEIYRQRAEQLIAQRGRGNYQAAVQLLVKVRALYARLGEVAAWQGYLANLRQQNRALRALREELTAVGM